MKIHLLLLVAICSFPLVAQQNLYQLPAWAQGPAEECSKLPAPADADAWVMLDRTEFAYTGGGEIKERRYRLVKVLTEAGISEAIYVIHGLGGKAGKVKHIKGWNLRPDGELVKLDTNEVVTVATDDGDALTTRNATGAVVPRVQKGSIIAFESLEIIHHPLGPVTVVGILEFNPIHRWEFIPAVSGGWFNDLKNVRSRMDLRHASPWLQANAGVSGGAIRLENLPALPRGEELHPHARNSTPWGALAFLDPALSGAPSMESWDSLARWFSEKYRANLSPLAGLPIPEGPPEQRLRALSRWMTREITYKQVYLAPERGWVPEQSEEVVRKRYGDCKDLTCCLLGGAVALGVEGFPVLARIGGGEIEADEPANVSAFNHVITALKLSKTLGFPAEIDTPLGRLLLIDPTARYTPLGYLPAAHRNGRVLICTAMGGTWVTIPESALEPMGVKVDVLGEVDNQMKLKGKLTFTETGDFLDLRSTFHSGGMRALRDLIAGMWDFSPATHLEISSASDPLDTSLPFKAEVSLDHLSAFLPQSGEWQLGMVGFPSIPPTIQRPGIARQYPVWSDPNPGNWEVNVQFKLSSPFADTSRDLTLETPFRHMSGTCKVEGDSLRITFSRSRKPIHFNFSQREEGVKQAKRDRSQSRTALVDFLTFKPRS